MTPKIVQNNRKRTLEQVTHDEEDNEMRTPDRTKRRKLLDDDETVLNAVFSTPLVKRKICSNRNTPIETPHSILKIRQLIRSSTSPTIGNLQEEIMDSPVLDKERKVNRQIRFNISQSKKSSSDDEINGKEDFSKLNTSELSEEVFESPTVSEKSPTENAILSNSDYTCKNVYTARPRPSLRRTYLQTSTESINESLANYSKSRNYVNSHLNTSSINILDNHSIKNIPQISKRFSMLSSSIHSTAILSPDSSFETNVSLRRTDENEFQCLSKIPKEENTNCIFASTPLIKSSIPEESQYSSKESINTEIEENIIPEMFCKDGNKLSESIHQSNHLELCDDEKLKNKKNNYKDLSSVKILETIRENYKNNEEECKNISNVMKKNLNHSENKEQRYQSFHDKPNEFIHDIEEYSSSKNGEHFDITDDESSDSDSEIVLVLDEIETRQNKQKQESKSISSDINNIYDDLNITDDESDSNMEGQDNLQRNITSLDRQENSQSKFSIKKKEVTDETKIKKESIRLDNNNSNKKTRKNSVQDMPKCTNSKDIVNISTLNLEVTPRITRSRRASSITKEINSSPLSSPSKVTPSKMSRSRRASSLVKEVLLGSMVTTDENIKQMISSGSEGLSEMSTPKRTRSKRASSVTKDVSIEAEGEEVKIPIRRSSRRSASVQKELEPVKSLTKNDEILSISNISTEGNMKKVQTKNTSSKMKQSSGGAKKSNANSSKLTKEYKTNEQEIEESSTIKSSRKRGSSVSKETISLIQTRRTSNIKEIVSQEIESPLEGIEEQFLVKQIINKPTANTRSRRLSIQSIPEELEEILSVPSKKRVSTANKRQQAAQNSRMRRAASVDLSQTDIKRKTRSTRSKGIFEETIIEEEIIETTNPVDDFNSKEVVMKKKRTTSDSSNQKIDGSRRARKSTKQDIKDKEANQFLFSQPEKTKDLPLDQKGIFNTILILKYDI